MMNNNSNNKNNNNNNNSSSNKNRKNYTTVSCHWWYMQNSLCRAALGTTNGHKKCSYLITFSFLVWIECWHLPMRMPLSLCDRLCTEHPHHSKIWQLSTPLPPPTV